MILVTGGYENNDWYGIIEYKTNTTTSTTTSIIKSTTTNAISTISITTSTISVEYQTVYNLQ